MSYVVILPSEISLKLYKRLIANTAFHSAHFNASFKWFACSITVLSVM